MGERRLKTTNLDEASEWLLDNISGLREFELQITIRSEDLLPLVKFVTGGVVEDASNQLSLWTEE